MEQAIVSAVIGGIFSLIGTILNNKLKQKQALPAMQPVSDIGQPPSLTTPPFSIGKSLIHIGVIQFIANVVVFILGLVMGDQIDTMKPETFILTILAVGSCVLIIGFAISGAKVKRAYRWQHLFYVAMGVLISTLFVNYLFFAAMNMQVPFDFSSLVLGVVQTFVCMGIGGAIANAVTP